MINKEKILRKKINAKWKRKRKFKRIKKVLKEKGLNKKIYMKEKRNEKKRLKTEKEKEGNTKIWNKNKNWNIKRKNLKKKCFKFKKTKFFGSLERQFMLSRFKINSL